jgi:two-component system, NarL family, response regulator NreC
MARALLTRRGVETRVLIADDHVIVRQGLKVLLEAQNLRVVGEAGDGLEAVRLVRELEPDVAVLDLVMPLLNGLDAAREIHQASPKTKTILLTTIRDDDHLLEALQAGVRGCVQKTERAEELIQAIHEVMRGGTHLGPTVSRAIVEAYRAKSDLPPDPLTARERQVLQLIAEGKSTRAIAALLYIGVKTAESHRAHIIQKLGIRETALLVRYAIHRGLSQL